MQWAANMHPVQAGTGRGCGSAGSWQRRIAVTLAAALTCLGAVTPASRADSRHHADGDPREWRGAPTNLAGRFQLSRGELVYTDYLYDDYGANRNGKPDQTTFRAQLAPTSGDARYPDDPDRYGYNAADLRELRLSTDGDRLHALVALQTMKKKDAAVFTIAVDSDGDASTGSGAWPDGSGLTTPGADRFITVWGDGARLTDAEGEARDVPFGVDRRRNVVEVNAPVELSKGARAWIAVGLNDGDGRFTDDGPFDLGFQGAETYNTISHWGDQRQADALASGDLDDFAVDLPLGDMAKGRSRPFKITPGFYNRIFRSKHSYGEGIELKQGGPGGISGTSDPQFLGRYQPYGLYIPQGYDSKRKSLLLLDGHSLDVNQNEYKAVPPLGNHLRQLGDERNSIVITPLARGADTWYLDVGFEDVLEAWRDVRRHYRVDNDRTSITGYSMGGYMTYRLGLLMPDRFVAASSYVGPPAYFQWAYPAPPESTPEWAARSNTNQIVVNGLNLPYEIVQGSADELVPVSGVVQQANTFRAAGNPYRLYLHSADDHLSFITTDLNWARTRDWLGTGKRNLSPVRVRYRRYPVWDIKRFGLRFDGAYWVDDMDVRDADGDDAFGQVDATTFARGGFRPLAVEETPRTVPGGPSPGVGGISPAAVTGQRTVNGEKIDKSNGFETTLTNLRSLRFRTRRMGLDRGRTVRAALVGDGTTTLRFDGPWPRGLRATFDGSPVKVSRGPRDDISVTVTLTGRAGELVLR